MSNTLFKWFTDNLLKANSEKSHLLTNSAKEIQINIGGMAISNSKCEKLLGIHIGYPFKCCIRGQFEKHFVQENMNLYVESKLSVSDRRVLITK